jgi:adenine phosphoribosyltransferase
MNFEEKIRIIKDFPKPGISFKDITPILEDSKTFEEIIKEFAFYSHKFLSSKLKIVALESRGFIFGAPLALKLGVPLILIRKAGKLPFSTYSKSYALEYGKATIEIHTDSFKDGDEVIIIDDVLATGGTAQAAEELILENFPKVSILSHYFLMELDFLKGKEKLKNNTFSLIKCND